ncbi:hypothetical protein Desgi_1447 [Desulfoscipio gibsoniae DSM 7213]|uniref:Uncharacterized protein n=1 Tax=Desulfoscipio gibsoniae DSM 7213 TaxID=767817 RepID=R4KEC1_9FIRM|nr:hypothetical protein Desgi_1447 [Desulfoscipio gibsoniae DSM 7213]
MNWRVPGSRLNEPDVINLIMLYYLVINCKVITFKKKIIVAGGKICWKEF